MRTDGAGRYPDVPRAKGWDVQRLRRHRGIVLQVFRMSQFRGWHSQFQVTVEVRYTLGENEIRKRKNGPEEDFQTPILWPGPVGYAAVHDGKSGARSLGLGVEIR